MSEIDREAMLQGETGMIDQTSIYDYDGKEYKINSSLVGKDCPFGGAYEEYNSELLAALREGYLKADGTITEKGGKELTRRKLGLTEHEKTQKEEAAKRRENKVSRQNVSEKRDLENKKVQLTRALEDIGYKGGWKLKRAKDTPDSFIIIFKETAGQIEEGRAITKEGFGDLLEFIREELPKMIKYK